MRGDGLVDDLFDQRQSVIGRSDEIVRRNFDILERDLRCAQPVHGREIASRDASRAPVDEEDA